MSDDVLNSKWVPPVWRAAVADAIQKGIPMMVVGEQGTEGTYERLPNELKVAVSRGGVRRFVDWFQCHTGTTPEDFSWRMAHNCAAHNGSGLTGGRLSLARPGPLTVVGLSTAAFKKAQRLQVDGVIQQADLDTQAWGGMAPGPL